MIRPFFTEVLLFATPFVLYVVFLWATKNEILHPDHWPVSRIVSLAVVALLLMLGSFLYFANYTGAPVGSHYEPAHMENGKFVPGRTR
jgi:multisubunit Na+/H+ antiporter MnhB subunit